MSYISSNNKVELFISKHGDVSFSEFLKLCINREAGVQKYENLEIISDHIQALKENMETCELKFQSFIEIAKINPKN